MENFSKEGQSVHKTQMEILARKNNITSEEVFLGICQQTGHGKESLTLSDKRLLTETAKSGNAKTTLLWKIIK